MIRGNAFHGFVSMPRRRRSWKVESESMISKSRLNFRRSFVLPLPLKHGRADDQDSADSPPQEEFFQDQPALDRLAQAHAIGQQQADTGHGQGPNHRLQLVGVDLDCRVPDAQQRLVLDAFGFPQPVQAGPAVGIDEGLKNVGAVGPVLVHAGQRGLAQHHGRGLDFPEQLLGFGVAEVVQVLDIDRCSRPWASRLS